MDSEEVESLKQRLNMALQEREKALNQAAYHEKLYQQSKKSPAEKSNPNRNANQSRDIKMALADCQFQLRKTKEDHATQKTMAEFQRLKLIRNCQSRVQELKAQMDADNQSWIRRFDIRNAQFQAQLQVCTRDSELKFKRQSQTLRETYEKKVKDIEREKEAVSTHLKEEVKTIIARTEREKKDLVRTTEDKWAQKVKDLELWLKAQAQNKEKEWKQVKQAMTEQRKAEQSSHLDTKASLQKVKTSLTRNITVLKGECEDLKQTLERIQTEKKEIIQTNIRLNQDIVNTKRGFLQHIEQLQQKQSKEREEIRLREKGLSEDILEGYLDNTQTLQSQLKQLQEKHQKQMNEHQVQLGTIRECYDQRPSRPQDLQMIRVLQDKLWKKENQLQMVGYDLRWHRLQLENKEETYTKIFTNGCLMKEIKFPAQKSSLRGPLTRETKFRRGKSMLNKLCHVKNGSFTENTPLSQICAKML